jgi:N-succinyldiaminopimelate aminotransferase
VVAGLSFCQGFGPPQLPRAPLAKREVATHDAAHAKNSHEHQDTQRMNRTIAALGTTIFETMSQRARELGAINLGQGFPDEPGPPELLVSAARALTERSSQYPPMRGIPELREAVAHYYAAHQSLLLTTDEIVITSGATEALAATFMALINPGDEVIVIQPLYDAYVPLIERFGGTPRFVSLVPPDWRLPLGSIAAAITPQTKLLLLNTPHNPTGSMVPRSEWDMLARLCIKHDLTLVVDEVWEGMIFDNGARHVSPMAVRQLHERCVKIGSAGKIFSLTGWKVGWACAPTPIAAAIARAHQYLTFTTPPALQWAVAEGLSLPPAWHAAHRSTHAHGRARLIHGLHGAGYRVLAGPGTWFVHVDLAASGIKLDDVSFCERLIEEAGVVAIPFSVFYAVEPETRFVRFCFTKSSQVLDAAIERLAAFRQALG